MIREIKLEDIRFYLSELQVSNLLYPSELAFVNYIFDIYIANNSKLKQEDLNMLNDLYTEIQIRKGYGLA